MNDRLIRILRHSIPAFVIAAIFFLPLVGCSKKSPELSPEDKEKIRQEHIDTMLQERGQG